MDVPGPPEGADPAPTAPDPAAIPDPGRSDDESTPEVGDPGAISAPPIVAVVPTLGGPDLEAAVTSLVASDYPDLTILVVHPGDAAIAGRVAAVAPRSLVRSVEVTSWAAMIDEVAGGIEGASFLFLCRDDIEVDPEALRLLVAEAYRSNAAIVGPKLVDHDDPRFLFEVGLAVDRYGVPYSEVERGELDQEQHDAVRDVFFVSDVAMLVRADLLAELDAFDLDATPNEALDLCWRARIAGARVLVAPDARVRCRPARVDERAASVAPTTLATAQLRAVLATYSTWSLLLVVPLAALHTLAEAVAYGVTGRRRRAGAALAAWWHVLRRPGALLAARRRRQALRRIPDRDLRELQIRGSARARDLMTRRLNAEERMRMLGDSGREAMGRATESFRQPMALVLAAALVVYVFGSRSLVLDGVPAIGAFVPWPGVSELLATASSGWRYTGMGSVTAPSPAMLAMSALSVPLLGATGLASTLLVVGMIPVGAWGAARLARRTAESRAAGIVAALAYLCNPVARNIVANGRLGALVLFGLTPWLVALLVRAAERRADTGDDARRARVRRRIGLAALSALAASVFPAAILVTPVVVVALALAVPFAGGAGLVRGALRESLWAVGGGVALVAPWALGFVLGAPDPGSLGLDTRGAPEIADLLRFSTGPSGSGRLAWGLLVAALLVVVIGSGPRFAWGARAWALAVAGYGLAWLPARVFDVAVPAPEAPLVLAALGLALAIGVGAGAFVEDLRGHHFGWRQVVSLAAAFAFTAPMLSYVADATGGRWHAPSTSVADAVPLLGAGEPGVGYRVLWVGDPTVLPLEPVLAGEVGWVLTRDGPGDARELARAPERHADRYVGDAVGLAIDGGTARLGHLLAPAAVRYVVVSSRTGAGSGLHAAPPAGVVEGMAAQTDLALLPSDTEGLTVYENEAWAPSPAIVAVERATALARGVDDPVAEALQVDVGGAAPAVGTVGPGVVLWAEAADDRWEARADGESLERFDAFGVTNAFELDREGEVSISFGGQWLGWCFLLAQLALVGGAVLWWRGPRRRRRVRRAGGEHDDRGLAGADRPSAEIVP